MFFLLSGEGASDMGSSSPQGDSPGPMARIADRFVSARFEFSPLEHGLVHWVSRAELSAIAKQQHLKPRMVLPGLRREAGYAGHTKHAAALAWKAVELEGVEGTKCIAVMFRDSDGTQSSPHDNWRRVVDAIEHGFEVMEFPRGVPMIPKPKQEAWLLCAKKGQPYVHCHLLEEESGNDNSPTALKTQLAAAVGSDPSTEDMCDWIISGDFDVHMIDMPSFNRFRDRLLAVLDSVAAG